MGRHLFAVYDPIFSEQMKKGVYIGQNKEIIHRIMHVLRMRTGQQLILFDRAQHATVEIISLSKKIIEAEVCKIQNNTVLVPHISVYIPLLKKDALAHAMYSAVELGASRVQYVITEKSRKSLSQAEIKRLERVVIAAAEQSKQFVMPLLHEPTMLTEIVNSSFQKRIYFDPDGTHIKSCVDKKPQEKDERIALLFGPEGDMTDREKMMIADAGWSFCALTPTVLRSVQVIAVGLGFIRSYMR